MPVLAVDTRDDGVLAAIAPLGLAAAAGNALVVDLDPDGPHYPGPSSLADLVVDGPRAADLRPARPGVAVLRNGGVSFEEAAEVVAALVHNWPATVLRIRHPVPFPTVPVVPLLPGALAPRHSRPAVWQPAGGGSTAPGPGPVLPRLSPGVVRGLLDGVVEPRRRWVRAWARVWELPWE
ncbi:MAG: hypothetical protein ACRDVM_04605 [Acidimicrobiia bacterium]